MPVRLIIILIMFALFFTCFVIRYVVKRKLVFRYAFLWMIFCIAMTIAVLSENFLRIICDSIGIETVSNFIFFLGFGLLLFITFILTSIVSIQKEKITTLAQEVAILKHERRK